MKSNDFRASVAEEMIRQIEAGTAAWVKPWEPGVTRVAPFNPTSGNDYRGINAFWLELQGYEDPRWLTYRQAKALDAQVRKGESGTKIEYWQWTETKPLLDESGKPVLDEEGRKRTRTVRLDRPRVFFATVFNAGQIEGLAPLERPAPRFEPIAEAERVMASAGVPIAHDQSDRAFYRPATDRIHLPDRAAFREAYEYYATALHELGHATGHPSRLARDMSGGFGSAAYAEEELRAEMASYLVTTEMGLGHYPERHAGYVESWLKAVRDDRNVLFRAARDADRIRTWIMEPEKRLELERAAGQARAAGNEQEQERETAMAPADAKRVYLTVPFAEKDQAKAAGARWDRRAKSWYAPDGADLAALDRWRAPQDAAPVFKPEEEFAAALKANGLVLDAPPAMDGRWHRVAVEGDAQGKKSGSYRGFADGIPNGQIMNFKTGGETVKWVATGNRPQDLDREALKEQATRRAAERAEALAAQHRATAKRAYGLFVNAGDPDPAHPYLQRKGVPAIGLKQDARGNLLVPVQDRKGFLWNVQTIAADGAKSFLKEGRKTGAMHALNEGGIDLKHAKTVIVAEGYATAASVHQATGIPAVVAFDGGNLKPVAEAIRKANPQAEIVIAADDDHGRERNVGLTKAREAAQAVGGRTIEPPLTKAERAKGLTDFNDLAASRGKEAFRALVRGLVEAGRARAPRCNQGRAPERALSM